MREEKDIPPPPLAEALQTTNSYEVYYRKLFRVLYDRWKILKRPCWWKKIYYKTTVCLAVQVCRLRPIVCCLYRPTSSYY